MAIYEDLEIDQGSTFKYEVSLTASNGSAYDLSGHTFAAQMKKNYSTTTVAATFSVSTTGVPGEIQISLTDEQTATLKAGRYVFDVLIENSSNEKFRVVEGIITVTPSVTTL